MSRAIKSKGLFLNLPSGAEAVKLNIQCLNTMQ